MLLLLSEQLTECSGSFKLLDLVLIYHDKAPIFSMCGFNVSIVHSNFSKYLFQFFKCVNTFSLQGPVIGPTKVLVEALDDVSIPIPVFPNKTSCEWFNVCMIMKRETAPLKQYLFY